jgi:hypothetical protein
MEQKSLAESSKKAYGSKRAVLPMMGMMIKQLLYAANNRCQIISG